ncbi:MAG: pitrilysin family protein [Candidatus Woesearchaeota archaeon]|jgi:predicted Zn-dependent peptidase
MSSVKKIILENGLTILLKKVKNTKKACIMININVGSINEKENEYGISHFTEHLAFKSNKYRSAKEISKDLEYKGTITNAFTSYENTVFFGKCFKENCKDTLQILFEAITNLNYKKEEVELERQVILTEIQNYIELPDKQILLLFLKDLYKGSHYGHPIEGYKNIAEKITINNLEEFKKENYVPNNMIICITGNFNQKEVISSIKNTFGILKRKELEKISTIQPINNKKENTHKRKELNQSFLALGVIVPNAQDKESTTIELLSTYVGEGMSSKMFEKLREEKGIGYSVGCGYYNLGKTACIVAYVVGFDKKQEIEAKNIIVDILKQLKNKEISDEELKGIKNYYLSRYVDEFDKVEFHALELLNKEIYNIPYDYTKKDILIKKITKKDMLTTSKKIFSDNLTISLLKS